MKVLVVDDESFVKDSIVRFLTRLGHAPMGAENGARAIDLYKAQRPDMVLLDILLPNIKGDEVFKAIKSFDKEANIYFITGSSKEYEKVQELHANGYFMKPIELGTIKKIIDGRSRKAE